MSNHLQPLGLGQAARQVWDRLPEWVVDTPPMRRLGHVVYDKYTRHTDRAQTHATFFLRNMPQIEVVRDAVSSLPQGAKLKVASMACSSGAELYSMLYVIRSARPDLKVVAHGVDISADIVEVARAGLYDPALPPHKSGLVPPGDDEQQARHLQALGVLMERTPDNKLRIKDSLREGIKWSVGDVTDPALVDRLGPQQLVIANNFLGPMPDELAEACLRNISTMVAAGGWLVVDGVDLDLKARVMPTLGLEPVTSRMAEIHKGDPTKEDWPWTRWSHEPFNASHPDRDFRYSTIFRNP